MHETDCANGRRERSLRGDRMDQFEQLLAWQSGWEQHRRDVADCVPRGECLDRLLCTRSTTIRMSASLGITQLPGLGLGIAAAVTTSTSSANPCIRRESA